MKQVITIRRTQTQRVEIEVIQALSRVTIEQIVNDTGGIARFGTPAPLVIISNEVEDWKCLKAEPQCECQELGATAKPPRKRR